MPPKVKQISEDSNIVKPISKKIKDFISHNKLAAASSATAVTALAITIGYVLNKMSGIENTSIKKINKFIDDNGQQLIDNFTLMESTTAPAINTFVRNVLNKLGHYIMFIPFNSLGGKLTEDSTSYTDKIKKTIKSVGKTLYDVAVSETGQNIGKAVLFTLILAGIAYGLGPRAAQFARPLLENMQNRVMNDPEPTPMSEDEAIYWGAVSGVLNERMSPDQEVAVLKNLRSRVPDSGSYHRRRPNMMKELVERASAGRGLTADYIKDTAHQAHKFITSEEGKKLGKTALTLGKTALSALLLAAISKGVHSVDKASSELYDYADRPSRERAIYNANRERQSMRSVARYANEFRNNDYFSNPELRV